MPAEDYETTIIGTIRQGQEKQVEEVYTAGDHVRGVIFAGLAKLLDGGAVDMDRLDLASAERGGVANMGFRVVTDTGEAVLDLGRQVLAAHPDSDTLYIPCPHFATLGVVEPLEAEFGVTVITALQAIANLRRLAASFGCFISVNASLISTCNWLRN